MKSVNEERKPDGDIHICRRYRYLEADGEESQVVVMVEADR